jgi:hypothetical protein
MSKFDWDAAGPSKEALIALAKVKSGDEFPHTYSGQAWFAAWRIWDATKDHPEKLANASPYGDMEGLDLKGWDGTGFMYGWALNAVRQMMGMKPGPNGAILTLGEPEQPAYPSIGPAENAMRKAIGGDE